MTEQFDLRPGAINYSALDKHGRLLPWAKKALDRTVAIQAAEYLEREQGELRQSVHAAINTALTDSKTFRLTHAHAIETGLKAGFDILINHIVGIPTDDPSE